MCGIWAIFGDGANSCEKCASCMKIAYRGPDRFRIESVQQVSVEMLFKCVYDNINIQCVDLFKKMIIKY